MKRISTAQMPLRIPISLHKAIKKSASQEGVSLNQYCLYLLARYSGNDVLMQQVKGEELLQFLEEARVLQNELKSPSKQDQKEPDETPRSRWERLYGKN